MGRAVSLPGLINPTFEIRFTSFCPVSTGMRTFSGKACEAPSYERRAREAGGSIKPGAQAPGSRCANFASP
jgi:hypothetical protein